MMPGSHEQGTLTPKGQTALHEAIRQTLGVLEDDIRQGRHVVSLQDALAQAMLANLGHCSISEEDIEGEVAL